MMPREKENIIDVSRMTSSRGAVWLRLADLIT
jgi:hypothetical protein